MAKTNVSKGDLRSKKRVNTKFNIKTRKECSVLTSKGICYYCKTARVKGRKTCMNCSTKQSNYTALWGFRKLLKQHGVDNPTDALETLALAKGEENHAVITALMNAIEASEYRKDVG